MEFRLDFFFRIIMDIFYYIINIGFYKIIFSQTDLLGGWNMDQMMIFISGFLVIDAISMTVFANNLWALPELINKGNLDFHLVRPVSSLFLVSVRDFAADSFINLLMACGLLWYSLFSYPGHLPVTGILLFICMLLLGTLLRYFLRMIFLIPTFWLHAGNGFEMVFFHLNRFIERPDAIFTGFTRILLTTLLPFCLMASFPARILLEGFNLYVFVHFIVLTTVFFFITVWFWKKGLRVYSSASS